MGIGLPAAIREDIDAFRPDIFHVSAPDIIGTRAVTFGRKLGIPIVASLHTRFETYFDHYGFGWVTPLINAHLHRFYGRCSSVLVPTEAIRQEMARTMAPERLRIWSRGVDRERFNPAHRDQTWRLRHGWDSRHVVVLFFGRLVREKGVSTYIEILHRLRTDGLPARPLVVGDGPEREAFAGLPDAVLTGHLSGQELSRAVASADIVLNPSTTEAFGNVILEVMAAGLAVVSADVPSARNLVDPSVTGLLCAPDNIERYRSAVARLINAPQKRWRLGRAPRIASGQYSWESASQTAYDCYVKVLGRV